MVTVRLSSFFCIFALSNRCAMFIAMKRISVIRLMSILLLLMGSLVSCDSFERGARRIERQLHLQQQRAEILTQRICDALAVNDFDTLTSSLQSVDDILLYIYHGQRLVYWTDSWLSSSYLPMQDVYDQWQYAQWNNAQGVCKRTRVGDMHVLTIIPIKYAYRVTSENLNNTFIQPFQGNKSWGLTRRQGK